MSCESDVASKNSGTAQSGFKEIFDAPQDFWGAF